MRKFLLLPLIGLFLLLLSSTISHAQTNAEIADFLSCGDQTTLVSGAQDRDPDAGTLYKSCGAGSFSGMPSGVVPEVTFTVEGDGYKTDVKLSASQLGFGTSGNYMYCGMTRNGQTYTTIGSERPYSSLPRITNVLFSAPGYTSQSYPIFNEDPCFTAKSNGDKSTQVGPVTLTKESAGVKHYGCTIKDNKSVCSETNESSDSTDPQCSNECTLLYLRCGDSSCSELTCSDNPDPILEESETYKDKYLGPFASRKLCDAGRGEATSTAEPTKPPKDLPPCKNKISDKGCTSVYSAFGILSTSPQGFLTSLFSILMSISGGIALLFIIRSGYQLMTSQGDPEKVKEARERITSAIVGLLFIVFSLVILEVIGVDILAIPGITR